MDRPSYAREFEIGAEPAAVHAALTDPAGLAAWWSPASGDGKPGGRLEFLHQEPEPLVIDVESADDSHVAWRVVEYPRDPEWVGTTISFHWQPAGQATALRFRHDGLTDRLECFAWCSPGWDYFLASFRHYLETGSGTPLPAPAVA